MLQDIQTKSVPLLIIDRNKIRQQWKKTASEVESVIEDIKVWVKTQNFPETPSDSIIEFFLTNCKYNLETTKTNLSSYYGIRKKLPEIFKDAHPRSPRMKEAWSMGIYLPLPQLTDDGYRLSINKILPYNGNFNCSTYFANALNVYEVRICEDLCISEIITMDYGELSWNHVIRMSPFMIHKWSLFFENVAKSRIKKVHVINAPSYINVLLSIVKKFVKKKIADRFVLHNNIDSLYEHISKDLLPTDYGGKQKSISELADLWEKKVDEYHERFSMFERLDEEK